MTNTETRRATVAKKADRAAYDIQHCCRTEPPKIPRLK